MINFKFEQMQVHQASYIESLIYILELVNKINAYA